MGQRWKEQRSTSDWVERETNHPVKGKFRAAGPRHGAGPALYRPTLLAVSHTTDCAEWVDESTGFRCWKWDLLQLGSVAPRHFSFMGSIAALGRLIAQTAPEVAQILLEDKVDAVLLTPV